MSATAWPEGRDRHERLEDVLRTDGLDLLVALTPENAEYLAGRNSYIATNWRIPGIFGVVAGPDGKRAIVDSDSSFDPRNPGPYPVSVYESWLETLDLRDARGASIQERAVAQRPHLVARPAQFNLEKITAAVVAAIHRVNEDPRRIGLDLEHIDVASFHRLKAQLPYIELVDASQRFYDLRAIKDADEIAKLRLAAELTTIGIRGAIDALRLGQSSATVNANYHIAVNTAVASDPRFAGFRQAEGLATIGMSTPSAGTVAPGETIRFDMQVDMSGYHSDIGRTVIHRPTDDQRVVYEVLRTALFTAQELVKPGVTFAEIFAAGTASMLDAGFTTFSRGHLGHSDGLTQNFEEAPFIAPGESRPLVAGMVLSLELPYYLRGTGGFQLERMLVVTEDGHETLDQLPFDLEIDLDRS